MATRNPTLTDHEKSARTLIVAMLGIAFLTGALGSRNTRAVFLTEGPAAKAFVASVPVFYDMSPANILRQRIANILSDIAPGGPRRGFALPANRPAGPGAQVNDIAFPPQIPDGSNALENPTAGTDTTTGGNPGNPGNQFTSNPTPPFTGTQPQPNPVGPGQFPQAPVPEPATWAMLLAGFLLVGTGLRSARRVVSVRRRGTAAA